MSHPKSYKSRIGGLGYVYYNICEDEYSQFIELKNRFDGSNNYIEQSDIEDGMVISGRSDKPVVLVVNDGKVSFRDATDLWGQSTSLSLATLGKEL